MPLCILRPWVVGLLECHAFGYCTLGCCASVDVMSLGTAPLDAVPPCTVLLGTVPLGITLVMMPGTGPCWANAGMFKAIMPQFPFVAGCWRRGSDTL